MSTSKRDKAFDAKEAASKVEGEKRQSDEAKAQELRQSASVVDSGQRPPSVLESVTTRQVIVQINVARGVGSPIDTSFADLTSLRPDAGWQLTEVNHPVRGPGYEVRSAAKPAIMMFVPMANVTHTHYQEREIKT